MFYTHHRVILDTNLRSVGTIIHAVGQAIMYPITHARTNCLVNTASTPRYKIVMLVHITVHMINTINEINTACP